MFPAVRLTGLVDPCLNMHGTFMLAKHSNTFSDTQTATDILVGPEFNPIF